MVSLKRKEIDQVNDDFSDFSLSSPATKIRCLDSDLAPIIEEDEPFPSSQDKAIVLFNPLPFHNNIDNSPLLRSPSSLSFSLSSDLISGFKNKFLQASDVKSVDFDEAKTKEGKKATEGCLAVVPWVPSRIPSLESRDGELEVPESSREADEMDVEENSSVNAGTEQGHEYEFAGLDSSEGLHHWPQQHCMPPQNPFNPITPWSQ